MSSQTWAMNKALSELVQRHGATLAPALAVPLSDPTSTPMVLFGLASTLDVDSERVAFAPFAFELPADIPLRFDHTQQCAGRIELVERNARGELTVQAYVDHPEASRCNAFGVSGDVVDYSLHDTDRPRSSRASRRSGFARSAWCLRRSTAAPGFCGASCRHRYSRLIPTSQSSLKA